MKKANKGWLATLITALGVSTVSTVTLAQNGGGAVLEEIFVTAQKREQSLQDVPISVQLVTGEILEETNIVNFEDLSNDMPGVTVTTNTSGNSIYIRGVGSGNSPGFQQSVGTFLDGIYLGRGPQSTAAFLDIQQIEVLRGPQSTYFGNNTIGGALNVITRSPGTELEGSISATYTPDDEELTVDVAAGGPLTETIGARLALRYYDLGGWMTNSVQGWQTGTSSTIDVPQKENVSGRLSLSFNPQDDLSLELKAAFSDQDQDYNTQDLFGCTEELATAIGPRRPGRDPVLGARASCNTDVLSVPGYEAEFNLNGVQGGTGTGFDEVSTELETENYSLKVSYDIGEYQLVAITGYSAYESYRAINPDGSPFDTGHAIRTEDFDQFSQEIKLLSPADGDFSFIAGMYFDTTNLETYVGNRQPTIIGMGPDAGQTNYATGVGFQKWYDEDAESYAVFAAGTWESTDKLSATVGLRYSNVDKEGVMENVIHRLEDGEFGAILDCNVTMGPPCVGPVAQRDNFIVSGDDNFNDFNQSFDLNWRATDNSLIYASYKNGFKAGGYDPLGLNEPLSSITFAYDSEEVDAYELGIKSSWLDNSLELNVALFKSEYKNLQVSIRDAEVGSFFIENAGEATTEGVEIEGRWAVVENLFMTFSLSLLDAAFDSWINEVTGLPVVDPGEQTAFSPEYSGNINVKYDLPLANNLTLSTVLTVNFTDDYKTVQAVSNPNTDVGAFERYGARIELSSGNRQEGWSLALIGKNLTDEEIWRFAVPAPQSAAGSFMAFADRGRSVSVQAKYKF